jgi:hypothetical protein
VGKNLEPGDLRVPSGHVLELVGFDLCYAVLRRVLDHLERCGTLRMLKGKSRFGGLRPGQRQLYGLMSLLSQYDSGGFEQYFFYSDAEYDDAVQEGLRAVQAQGCLGAFDATQTCFPQRRAPTNMTDRQRLLITDSDSGSRPIACCLIRKRPMFDDARERERLDDLCESLVRSHPSEFLA